MLSMKERLKDACDISIFGESNSSGGYRFLKSLKIKRMLMTMKRGALQTIGISTDLNFSDVGNEAT